MVTGLRDVPISFVGQVVLCSSLVVLHTSTVSEHFAVHSFGANAMVLHFIFGSVCSVWDVREAQLVILGRVRFEEVILERGLSVSVRHDLATCRRGEPADQTPATSANLVAEVEAAIFALCFERVCSSFAYVNRRCESCVANFATSVTPR